MLPLGFCFFEVWEVFCLLRSEGSKFKNGREKNFRKITMICMEQGNVSYQWNFSGPRLVNRLALFIIHCPALDSSKGIVDNSAFKVLNICHTDKSLKG